MDFLFPTFLLVSAAVLATFAYAGVRAAPWVPMWSKDMERVLRVAKIQPGQVVYDLGCGDGRLLEAAAREGAIAKGFEISLLPYVMAKVRFALHRTKNASVRFADFWNVDIRDADAVFFFLTPKIYKKMQSKCERELKPGAVVIAYVWPFDGWEATTIDRMPGQPDVYMYKR